MSEERKSADVAEIFKPFDIVYDHVNDGIDAEINKNRNKWFGTWLSNVKKGFLAERAKWHNVDLDAYVEKSSKLYPRYLRLSAGAYLHITYDLPRVMADEWPDDENKEKYFYLTRRYREIDHIFSGVASLTMSDVRVVGRILKFISKVFGVEVFRVPMGYWIDALRSDAIHNAYTISEYKNRPYIDGRLRIACIAAISHVSHWKPWTFFKLAPYRFGTTMAIPPIFYFGGGSILFLILILISIYFLVNYVSDIILFERELGRRMYQYAIVAIHNPEELENYIERRSVERYEGRSPD